MERTVRFCDVCGAEGAEPVTFAGGSGGDTDPLGHVHIVDLCVRCLKAQLGEFIAALPVRGRLALHKCLVQAKQMFGQERCFRGE